MAKSSKISLSGIISQLKKKYGDEAAVLLSDPEFHSNAPYGISTQCLALDLIIGRPGIPAGRITEISGLEGAGKSTLGEHLIHEVQRMNGIACLIETEHGRDQVRLKRMGIQTDSLIILQPDTLEDGFKMIESFVKTVRKRYAKEIPLLIIWDSVAQIQTASEEKDNYDDAHMALHARLISQGLRKQIKLFAKEQVTVVFINQLKANIGTFGYGDKWRTFGGKAIAYTASLTMRVKRKQEVYGVKKTAKGYICNVKVWKNKVGVPKNERDFMMLYKTGLDKVDEMFKTATENGLFIEKDNKFVFMKKKFKKNQWPIVVKKLGGPDKTRDLLLKRAIKLDVISDYNPA